MIQRRGLTEPLYKTIDYIHYIDFGLQLRPNDCNFLIRKARELKNRQEDDGKPGDGYSHEKHEDYSYIDVFKEVLETEQDWSKKRVYFSEIIYYEAHRDYHSGTMKQFQTLKQIDTMPDYEIKEAQWDLYKISMSDIVRSSFAGIIKSKSCTRSEWLYHLKGSHHRVLFQNASGTINMIQHFDDPNLELDEIAWFHILAECMMHTHKYVQGSQRLIKLKKGRNLTDEDEYMSCYVELHSHPVGSNGQNHILAQTPFKFLPVEEFEKRQKSITSTGSAKDWVPKELMAPPKSSKPAPKPKNGKKKNKKRNK